MNVYLVMEDAGHSDGGCVGGVFSSEEKAKEWIEAGKPTHTDRYIEIHEVDEMLEKTLYLVSKAVMDVNTEEVYSSSRNYVWARERPR